MKMKKNIWVIWLVCGLTIGLTICICWTIYIFTLPDLNEQLKYSFFGNDGEYVCDNDNFDFKIVSKGEDVNGILNYQDEVYNFDIYYYSTRGFNHKYAFSIQLNCIEKHLHYSCYGEFEPTEFTLKKFYSADDNYINVFKDIKELHFNTL